MKAKPGDLATVRWIDTLHETDITEHEAKALSPAQVTSYGRLLVVNDNKVTLSGTEFSDGELREVSVIPRCVVTGIKKLEEV